MKAKTKPRKCFWCHEVKHIYGYSLCMACYKWFHKYKNESVEYCSLCGKFITKRNKGICAECRAKIHEITKEPPKRLEFMEKKFEPVVPLLQKFESMDKAFEYLHPLFKTRQTKFLEIILRRFFNHETMENIAKDWGVSREYIRQCENNALKILTSLNSI